MIRSCTIFWSFLDAEKKVVKILTKYKLLELRSLPLEPLNPWPLGPSDPYGVTHSFGDDPRIKGKSEELMVS